MKRTERPGSSIRRISVVAFNIVLFFFLVELFSILYIYKTEHRLHYLQAPDQNLPEPVETKELTHFRFHPYFGVIQKPGYPIHTDLTSNNCGFSTRYDFPYVRKSDSEFVVGIFGGSVAEMFADVAQDHFSRQLKRLDSFRDKDIIILNFARGGYKQPQQLLVLAYFLSLGQHFDLVVNIDGFNEVVLAQGNVAAGIDASMPSADHILPLVSLVDDKTMTVDSVNLLYRLTRCKEKIARGVHAMSSSVFAFSYAARRITDRRNRATYSVLLNEYSEELADHKNGSLVCLYDDLSSTHSGIDTAGDVVHLWKTASTELHLTAQARDFQYVHFIQPNQYYSRKVFTKSELDTAVRAGSDRRLLVEKGYPRLLKEVESLRSSGVHIFSLVDVFDDISETVYVDDCCHFNKMGNYILAEEIAALIDTVQSDS